MMRSFQVCTCGEPLAAERAADAEAGRHRGAAKVLAAGVCHSDLHIWDGYFDLGGGKKLSSLDRGMKLPITLGHENVGEVVAVGPEAKGVKVGDERLVRSVDRLRRMRGLQARRREALPQAAATSACSARRLRDAS